MIVYQYLHYLHTTNILSTPNNYTEYLHHLLTIYGPQAWDPVMLKHSCLCGDETLHPESPGRLERILAAVAGGQSHVFEGRTPNIIIELFEGISNAPCNVAEADLLTRCELVRRTATLEELCSVHAPQVNIYSISRYIYIYMSTHLHIYISTQHVSLHATSPLVRGTQGLAVTRLPCGGWGVDTDTVWNDIHTPTAAKVAAGSVIELVNKGRI